MSAPSAGISLVADVPALHVVAFTATLPAPLGELATPPAILALLRDGAEGGPGAPALELQRDETVRTMVRDSLRHDGYKPTGRGKPASEYLVRAAAEGALGSINLLVDACNAVSLHSGLPISIVDLDRAGPPFRVAPAAPGASYVFNASGQEIDLGGLPCLFDAQGPCANAVRDSQRTKTQASTMRALCLLWVPVQLVARGEAASRWYRGLLETQRVATVPL